MRLMTIFVSEKFTGESRMCKIDQLIGGYLNKEIDDWDSTIIFLLHLNKLDKPFDNADEAYAKEVVQIWKPPYLKGIEWF